MSPFESSLLPIHSDFCAVTISTIDDLCESPVYTNMEESRVSAH